MMRKLMVTLLLMPMMAFATTWHVNGTAGSFPDVTTWKFYEEADDELGLNLAAWEDWNETDVAFWIGEGINMAIPVEWNLSASDVVLVAGTYSGYRRVQVVSDEWMFAKHYTSLKTAIGQEPYGNEYGAYGWVFEDDVGDKNYSLSLDIWPEKKVVSGRKWILLEIGGNPTKGCKTFYLGVKGRDDAGYSRFRIYATPDQGVSQSPSSWSSKRELAVLPMPIDGGTTSGSGMYASGTQVTLSAKPNSGYEFEGWYDKDSGQLIGTAASLIHVTTGANGTIFARFYQKAGCIVTFDANGGSLGGMDSVVSLVSGSSVGALPTPTREKHKFLGWYTAAEGGTKVKSSTKVTADVTYYAHWEYDGSALVTVVVADGCEGMGTVTGGGKTVKAGTKVSLKATAGKGHVFVGWRDGDGIVVSQSASWSYVATGEPATIEAMFATVEDDVASLKVAVDDVETEADGTVALDLGACVESLTPAKLAVSGLPSGIKYDSKTLKIAGKATKPGVYTVTVKATNTSVKKANADTTATFFIAVPNLTAERFMYAGLDPDWIYELRGGAAPDLDDVLAALVKDGWKLAVSGLPSGVKYDAKANTFTGTASKDGFYTVTFTATRGSGKTQKKEVATATFEVVFPELAVGTCPYGDPKAAGTATGGGKYSAGKKVTLKATPAKNCVFAGWFDEYGYPLCGGSADYRTASYAYVTTDEDVALTAMFATAEEDAGSLHVEVEDVYALDDGTVDVDLGGLVSSVTLPKLTVSGLPSGVKYNSKTLKIAGKVTKPGIYEVKIAATNTSVKKANADTTATFFIIAPNLSCAALPYLMPGTDAYGKVMVGVTLDADRIDCRPAAGWSVKVAGLPAGLKYDAKTGKITGVPTAKAGAYTVTFTASKKGEANQVATITLNVEALPEWAVGTFSGDGDYTAYLWGQYECYDFVHTVTIGANGKVSGSITVDVTPGKQVKASFSASALSYDPNVHLETWIGHNGEWECTYDGPVYYCDVDITLDGKKKTRRLYVCDLGTGTYTDCGEELPKCHGVGMTLFAGAESDSSDIFEGDGDMNVWANKAYMGPLPEFASSTVTKTEVTEDGDECTFSFKQNGSVAVKIKRVSGQSDSASFTLAVLPQDGGKWFFAGGDWIFPKGSIADVDFRMTPNKKGVIGAEDIEVTGIDVDIDD